jgi:hypothetical protein
MIALRGERPTELSFRHAACRQMSAQQAVKFGGDCTLDAKLSGCCIDAGPPCGDRGRPPVWYQSAQLAPLEAVASHPSA